MLQLGAGKHVASETGHQRVDLPFPDDHRHLRVEQLGPIGQRAHGAVAHRPCRRSLPDHASGVPLAAVRFPGRRLIPGRPPHGSDRPTCSCSCSASALACCGRCTKPGSGSTSFSLHANTWVAPRDRERLEALCRYAARPAVSESRLAELPDGRIGYARKRRFGDGTTAGAAAGCRHGAGGGGGCQVAGADNAATTAMSAAAAVRRQQAERRARARLRVPHRGSRRRSHRQRLPWADLLRRVFGIDVLVCPQCAGQRRVLAAIHDPAAIARVLAALGLTAAGADPAGCRA
ncbi:MAG: hypothetical protein FJ301_14580, partial [Planctomycetes bacterium]|nr:hypothetical protein [Planctomycetota bacterium]